MKTVDYEKVLGAPDRDRTCDLQFRKLTLYPTELRMQKKFRPVFKQGRYYSINPGR